ncbi:hypothetical protein [Dyella flagellata]|uniref:Uncharacterized protein n=1 Tax=Dyella flagellata TaxID=1867833 RepID=A0ABQ5X4L2_9GAMM|nr:hypothetical protein [Dyella flagellata]GLQ86478.1 hypothetical protein GCM10007898_00440 [Dyella flagellata]
MTTIFNVVDTSAQLLKREESRQPAQDFAHELAKPDVHGKQSPLPTPSQTKSMASEGFDVRQSFEPAQPNADTATNETLPPLPMQDAVLEPVQANQPVTVAPTGVTEALLEARVFGWHAMAQAYLSELTAADAGVKQSGSWQSERGVLAEAAEAVSEPLALNETVAAEPAEPTTGTSAVDTLPVQSLLTPNEATPAHAIEATMASSSAPALWPERSLRFTRQRDGSSVAWLRDFRLSDSEASHLIRWVLSDARAKGMALGKIMLNGREVWTSPQFI